MPRPPRLGQSYVGNERTLWKNLDGRDAQATEIGPNILGNEGKLWANRAGGDAHATEIGPNLSWGYRKVMEQLGRHRSPGHRDCAKPMLRMSESYGATKTAEMPRPPRLGQT